ncbi:MAG: substrate-binding domain-containing protein [Pseudomonadota bacterium]
MMFKSFKHWGLSAALLALVTACGPHVDLSAIPEQPNAPPVSAIGEVQKIKIVGSSTVSPFSTTVAEQFGAISMHPAPIVETTGTGGGFKAFCNAIGPDEPSIVNASRKIKDSERALCAASGIADPFEVKIGYDGIVLANAKAGPELNLTKADIFRALAANLPDGSGGWVRNPHRTWADVNPDLPNMRILVSGPPPTSGTRDAFVEIALETGALELPDMVALQESDPAQFTARAREIRNDGAWIDSGENDSSIINTLLRNDDSVGVLGYSFLEQNLDRVKAAKISGVAPNFENITRGEYGVSRSMYFYIKIENRGLVPGLVDFVAEFTQEDAWGPDGYLIEKGLIPLLPEERQRVRDLALATLTDPKNPLPSENAPSPQQTDENRPG